MMKVITNTIVLIIFFFCYSSLSAVLEQYKKSTVADMQEEYTSKLPKPKTIEDVVNQANQLPSEVLQRVATEYQRLQIIVFSVQIILFPLFGWLFKWLNTPKIVVGHE